MSIISNQPDLKLPWRLMINTGTVHVCHIITCMYLGQELTKI